MMSFNTFAITEHQAMCTTRLPDDVSQRYSPIHVGTDD